jgi:hypothetical protein
VEEFTLAVTFRNIEHQFVWASAGGYGPNSHRNRRLLWDELPGFLSWWNLPCCIGGDFNVTRFPRLEVAHLCTIMMEFSDFICDLGLMDLPLVGGTYSWSNNRESSSWSRIDRFLVSPTLEAKFSGVLEKAS